MVSSTKVTQFPPLASFRSWELLIGKRHLWDISESGWKPEVNLQVTAPTMSQVMSSSLLAGGHAVHLASCEEPRRALHPAPSPSLPPQCPYYTTEGWGAQALMAPMPYKEAPNRLQQAPQAGAKASCLLQSPGEQASGALEDLDSYIDFSLESLNQMILELDPTFQLLPAGAGGSWAEPTQSTTSRKKKEEPEALGKDLGHRAGRAPLGKRTFLSNQRNVRQCPVGRCCAAQTSYLTSLFFAMKKR